MKKLFSFIIALGLVAGFISETSAQTRNYKKYKSYRSSVSNKRRNKKPVKKEVVTLALNKAPIDEPAQPVLSPSPVPSPLETNDVTLPESSERELSTDLENGNVPVSVSSNGNAVFKIGLYERGVAVIDFPSNDPVYRIHPGDENFVTVGCTERDQNGKCGNSPTDAIILRPGKNFHALGTEESSATVITIQRVSGTVISLIIVPVKEISQNTNYLVVRYDVRDAVEARLKAGLAVNLQPGAINLTTDPKLILTPGSNSTPQFQNVSSTTLEQTTQSVVAPSDLEATVTSELQRVAESRPALQFTKSVYGLSLAKATTASRTGDITIEVIAVRNTLPQAIRLMAKQPTLVIENRDKRKESVSVEPVVLSYVSTTVLENDVLEPGQIYYYAFAYASPVLGAKQVLRVNFTQREASDAPASLELGGFAR